MTAVRKISANLPAELLAAATRITGKGITIAVLDTGVDPAHPFLVGKISEEACYSRTVPGLSQTVCPNGLPSQIGPGSAVPCPLADCIHGTHVAGIIDIREFAFDQDRARDFADDLDHQAAQSERDFTGQLMLLSLRASFASDLADRSPNGSAPSDQS